MKITKIVVLGAALAAFLCVPRASMAQTPPAAPGKTAPAKAGVGKKAEVTPPPSAQEIADAKSKGLVWVNLNTGVYHKDGEFYGKTRRGRFMTEDDAKKAGHRAAKEPGARKTGGGKKGDSKNKQ